MHFSFILLDSVAIFYELRTTQFAHLALINYSFAKWKQQSNRNTIAIQQQRASFTFFNIVFSLSLSWCSCLSLLYCHILRTNIQIKWKIWVDSKVDLYTEKLFYYFKKLCTFYKILCDFLPRIKFVNYATNLFVYLFIYLCI